jgi:hypothetical protein
MEYKWNFLERGDGRLRLQRTARIIRRFKDGTVHVRFKRSSHRLMASFSRRKLLKIAWKTDVTNPEGFDRGDTRFLGVDDDIGFEFYKTGWVSTTKIVIGRYIWNRLYDLYVTR